MKKKIGFTLAEVLITLGIIGVVAALATPALNSSVQKSKVGPTLRKFISTMENANEHIIADKGADQIDGFTVSIDEYFTELEKYVKGAAVTGDNKTMDKLKLVPKSYSGSEEGAPSDMEELRMYDMADGSSFGIKICTQEEVHEDALNTVGSYKGKYADIYYDINGFETAPNRLGRDIFHYIVDANGSMYGVGGKRQYRAYKEDVVEFEQAWKTNEEDMCNDTTVSTGNTCSGSIEDNDWKVIYKY